MQQSPYAQPADNRRGKKGTNKRYAHRIDEAMDERIAEMVARDGPLATLTDEELDLRNQRLTIDPVGVPVHAPGMNFRPSSAFTVANLGFVPPTAASVPSRSGLHANDSFTPEASCPYVCVQQFRPHLNQRS